MPDSTDLYLELLKKVLVNTIYRDHRIDPGLTPIYDENLRLQGADWPRDAHTMIGRKRLDSLDRCCRLALAEKVPGDFLEAGVWRGGASIFMRAVLRAFGEKDRRVILADSFAGLPPPDPQTFPDDEGDVLHTIPELRISLDDVRENFSRYDLLDDQVVFLQGWFKDTLPVAPIERIAVLRLDGDMYASTWQALEALYPKASPRAFIIIDDYGAIPACKKAVHDFRAKYGITAPITEVDWTGIYWRKD